MSIVRTRSCRPAQPRRASSASARPRAACATGDSGSGFVEILDGRAQLVGVTSNIDGGSGDCIDANKQAELVDVFAYRDWIYSTMGMSPEQADGRVRLRWSGLASQPGTMSLQCLSTGPTMPAVAVSMNIPGSEIAMDECDGVRVFCQSQGTNRNMTSFTKRTFASNGRSTATSRSRSSRPSLAAGERRVSSSRFNCGVYNLHEPRHRPERGRSSRRRRSRQDASSGSPSPRAAATPWRRMRR